MSSKRYFTAEEANEALSLVRPLAERMVEQSRALDEARSARDGLVEKIAGNGGGIEHEELRGSRRRVRQERAELVRCIDAIHELGAVVKDPETGLLDFPALSHGDEVLLCWQVGEDEIAYWHTLEDGFAGRRPLPLE